MTTLIIAEKPNACQKIVSAISEKHETKRKNGINYYHFKIGNEEYYAVPAVGHLFNLSHKKGAKVPIFDLEWKPSHELNRASKFTKKYLDNFISLKKKVKNFIVATDYDIEGSVIAYTILKQVFGVDDAKRMKFSTLTKDELKESFEKMNKHLNKGYLNAGILRHYLDYFWGINSSRALMSAIKTAGRFRILSIGRVQGPALKILYDREREIEKFKPQNYYEIYFNYNEFRADYPETIDDKKKAEILFNKVNRKTAEVKEKSSRIQNIKQPEPFNLTTLQTTAYNVFKMVPVQTLNIAQKLYEGGLISYPRTSSQKLPSSIGYKKILQKLSKKSDYSDCCKKLLEQATLFPHEGEKEDSAHPAIYPTGDTEKLTGQSAKIYDLIARRFISTFMEEAKREVMKITFDVENEIFEMHGHKIEKKGFLECYGKYYGGQEKEIPPLKEGEKIKPEKYVNEEKQTKPPARYSQASIINFMDKINLGTKATRTNIIKTLYDRGYISERTIEVTELGKSVIEILQKYSPKLISAEMTSEIEREMERIEKDELKKEAVLEKAKRILTEIMSEFKEHELKIGKELIEAIKDDAVIGTCPKCGSDLRILRSRASGKRFVGCKGFPKCHNAYPLPQSGAVKPLKTNCEECLAPEVLILRQGKRPWKLCINPKCPTKEKIKEKN